MNDTFLNTLLELSELDRREEKRPSSVNQHRPSSVLFSRPPSSILVSRPPSAAFLGRPHSALKVKRPPSTSTLKPRPPSGVKERRPRPPSVSTITRPNSSLAARHINSLKCNVCNDGFRFPGNVPCFDNYCTNCLEEHILTFKRGTGCDCALCKCAILLPSNTSKFQSNQGASRSKPSELNVCDNCGQSRLAQYRCNKCEENFCERCSKDFLRRMRIDSSFNVAHLTDLSGDNSLPVIIPGGMEDVDDSIDTISLPSILPKGFGLRCIHHEEEELRFYCVACDIPVCRDCKILEHEGHNTKALEDVYEDRRAHLSQAVKLANANVRKLHMETAEINSKRLEIDQESRDVVSLIENHANLVKKFIDDMSRVMIKTIRAQNTESRGKLQECRDRVKDKVTVLQSLVEESTALLAADDGIDIVKKSPVLVERLNSADTAPTAERLWRKKFVFHEEMPTTANVSKAFGALQTVLEGLIKDLPTVDLEILNTFNCDQKHKQTTAVAPMSDGTVWVCNDYKNKIQQFSADGNLIRRETLDFDVDDMVDGLDGRIYLTEYNGKIIRKITDGRLAVFARTDTYLRGLALSRDSNTVLTCGNDVPVACLRETATCRIYVFGHDGKRLREIMIDTGVKGVSLFRLCHTINDEFVISTGISALYYIIGEGGGVRYRYQAASTADGVACDKHGLIYLSSCKDDTLYVLDCKGVPIPTTYAMHKPTAVAIDRNDTIWVGDWSKIHVLKYKE